MHGKQQKNFKFVQMRLYLDQEIFKQSPVLAGLLRDFEQRGLIIVSNEHKTFVEVSFVVQNKKKDSELILSSVIYDNCRLKLLDDLFQNYLKISSDDKYYQALKDLYDGYVTSTMLNQKYFTQVSFESFTQNAKEKNKDERNFCDIVDDYIQNKRNSIVKHVANLRIIKEDSTTTDLVNKINEIKERRRELKARILAEQIKSEQSLDDATKRMNLIQKSFNLIIDLKCTQEIENDNIDLIYQENIFKNLKFFREFIEKKVMSELYTRDQVAAFRVVRDLLEKKLLFAENDRSYINEKLEKQKKNPDIKLGSVIAEISEVNRIIKKKERELHRLKNPQS